MIAISKLEKKFGKLEVLKGVDVAFEPGKVVSIIGPNGSGKTTLIKSVLGMVVPDKGTLEFNGKPIARNFDYRNHIGYMPQIGRYPGNMQMGQLFDMMKDIRKAADGLDEDLITAFKLPGMFNKPMGTLSGGTTQKVSAALAFLFNPSVLILDEPTAGLDPLSAEILKSKILQTRAQNRLIIITSHIMSEVEELADNLLYLYDGQVKFYKPVAVLKQETGEERLGKAIAKIMLNNNNVA